MGEPIGENTWFLFSKKLTIWSRAIGTYNVNIIMQATTQGVQSTEGELLTQYIGPCKAPW